MTFKRLMEAKAKAEESKKLTMETLKKMQKTFKELIVHNQKLPLHLRLFREVMLMKMTMMMMVVVMMMAMVTMTMVMMMIFVGIRNGSRV